MDAAVGPGGSACSFLRMSEGVEEWHGIDPAAARALELAHDTLLAGGLAVGCVIVDASTIATEGRNRAYDPATGTDPLEQTPLAHAEMNALARIGTDVDPSRLTLWSTQQPCSMCQAAIHFIGIGNVRVIATDPSNAADRAAEAVDDEWVILATSMFLIGPLRRGGHDHPMVLANRQEEPEAVELAIAIVGDPSSPLTDGRSLKDAVEQMWSDLRHAADRRRAR
jgi:tRNA(Arg) A34 adenosine deaminase TadA